MLSCNIQIIYLFTTIDLNWNGSLNILIIYQWTNCFNLITFNWPNLLKNVISNKVFMRFQVLLNPYVIFGNPYIPLATAQPSLSSTPQYLSTKGLYFAPRFDSLGPTLWTVVSDLTPTKSNLILNLLFSSKNIVGENNNSR